VNPTTDRQQHFRAGRRLEYFTLGWNLTEAAVALGAGLFAGSIALIGFGTDSLIESLSGWILLWRLYATTPFSTSMQLLGVIGINDERATTRTQRPLIPPPRGSFS
jgi:hypothetical protein